jgi:hypothetical protein
MIPAGENRIRCSRARRSAALSTHITFKLRSYQVTKFTERHANNLLRHQFYDLFLYSKTTFLMQRTDIFMLPFHENFLRLALSVHYFSLQIREPKKIFAGKQFFLHTQP